MFQTIPAKGKEKKFSLLLTFFPWLLSFYLESFFFESARSAHIFTYIACKSLLFIGLFLLMDFLVKALWQKDKEARSTLAYGSLYFGFLLIWLLWKGPRQLAGDELNIYTQAKDFNTFAYWFNYFTGYYWITCAMLLPFQMGPILVKMILQALVMGYCTRRLAKHSSPLWALLLFVPYLQPFVLDMGVSAHRLPLYGILYLYLGAKLFFDHKEEKSLDPKTFLILTIVIAIISYWRTEGLYLTVMGGILLIVAYRVPLKNCLSRLWKPAVCYVLILVIVAVPQIAAYMDKNKPSVMVRSAPLCGYALANMLRNGLEEEDIPTDAYEIIDRYIPFEELRKMNETQGDRAYADAMAMDLADPNADFALRTAFCDSVKSLIIQHPFIYLRSQWNSFCYTTSQYRCTIGTGTGWRYLSYNQWIPLLLCCIFLCISLVRRQFLSLLLTLCAVGNWALVTALMPAAYAKYFYVDYLFGYFFLFVSLAILISKKRGKHHG